MITDFNGDYCSNCQYAFSELYKGYNGDVCHDCYKKESENFECHKCKSVYHEAL